MFVLGHFYMYRVLRKILNEKEICEAKFTKTGFENEKDI